MSEESPKIAKIVVDRNLCIGAGSCLVAAGDVFELDEENKAVIKLKNGEKNSGPAKKEDLENNSISDDAILESAQSCPTAAILLYDENDKQIYPT